MTRDEVLAKLAELPNTADGIARFLAERGVRGVRYSAKKCPIAAHTGARLTLNATYFVDGCTVSQPLPSHVSAFIAGFDGGRYPELIA